MGALQCINMCRCARRKLTRAEEGRVKSMTAMVERQVSGGARRSEAGCCQMASCI